MARICASRRNLSRGGLGDLAMCTVTFIPRRTGYCLAMNRDEKRTRPKGLAPVQRNVDGRLVVYPSEPSGGTWVALNDHGASLALINWYSVKANPRGNIVSRGEIIPAISNASNSAITVAGLTLLPLHHINPFRLIGVF